MTIIGAIVYLDRFVRKHNDFFSRKAKKIFFAFVIVLIILHVYEVKDYIKPLKATTNVILNIFNKNEVEDLKSLLNGKKALFMVPNLRSAHALGQQKNMEYGKTWDKLCYSLAFYSGVPVNCEYDDRIKEHSAAINVDVEQILSGNLQLMKDKYGDIAIASPLDVAQKIQDKTNIPLNSHRINDFVILTFINKKGEM